MPDTPTTPAPPPHPISERPPNWWERFIEHLEDWLDLPFARTLSWFIAIVFFVAFGYLWYYLQWHYIDPSQAARPFAPARPISLADAGGPIRFIIAWTEPFFQFLLSYPLFPLVILFFWLVSWGGLGRGLGIPELVWPESWWQRFWVGVAGSLLFANLLFVRYVLETVPGTFAGPPDFGPTPSLLWFEPPGTGVRQLGAFLFWTLIPCLLIFYLPKIPTPNYLRLLRRGRWFPATFIGLIAGVAITVGLFWIDTRMGFSAGMIWQDPWYSTFEHRDIWLFDRELHIRSMVMAGIPVFFLALFMIESRFGGIWSPVWSVCLVIALISSIYGFIAFYLSGLQFIVLGGLIVLACFCISSMRYKLTFPGLERYRLDSDKPAPPATGRKEPPLPRVDPDAQPTKPRPPAIAGAALLKKFAENWKAGPGRGTDTLPKLVIFGVSGGGIRAAVWTAAVLEGLEDQMPGSETAAAFRDHIRIFTGASGGMLAAALYAADFERPPAAKTPEKLSAMLARDSLWRTIQTMIFTDLPAIGVPWTSRWDRGRSLEAAWNENTRPYANSSDRPNILRRAWLHLLRKPLGPKSPLEKSFADLHDLEAEARRPSLLFSPMLVEDCRRLLITNLEVAALTQALCPSLNHPIANSPPPEVQSVEALDFFRYFPDAYSSLHVSTAARMSATFPFVTPGVSLPTDPPRRVVDAGYFDNFGVNLAALWLLANHDAVREYTSGVVLVEVLAYPRRAEKVQFREGDGKGDLLAWGLSELSTPAEAVLNLYARGAYFRNDQLLQFVAQSFDPPGTTDPFFTTVSLECNGPATLSWTLPTWEADAIMRAFRNPDGTLHPGVVHEVDRLKAWFGTGGAKARKPS